MTFIHLMRLNIFPNPTHDFITISNNKNINEIILTTLDGRIIKKIAKLMIIGFLIRSCKWFVLVTLLNMTIIKHIQN